MEVQKNEVKLVSKVKHMGTQYHLTSFSSENRLARRIERRQTNEVDRKKTETLSSPLSSAKSHQILLDYDFRV